MNHLELGALESAAIDSTPWEKWADKVEAALGHSLDGDQASDGYSVDGAYEAYCQGMSIQQYVAAVSNPDSATG